jgi:TolB-like protein
MLAVRRAARVPLPFAAFAVSLALAACASTPLRRRTTQIADADRQAKAAIAAENQIDAAKIPARSFAVTPFTVSTRDTLLTPLGFGLADLLSTDLAHSRQLSLVERLHMDAIMRELDLVDQGITDPRTAPRVGKLMGARRLLIGDISSAGNGTVRLQARVVDVLSGTVQELAYADAPLNRIIDAEKSLALLLFDRLGITLTPAERVQVEQRQTTQLAALVAYGKGADAEAHGDAQAALAAYADAAHIDPSFRTAQVQAQAPAASTSTSSSASQPSRASAAIQQLVDLSSQAINQPITTQPITNRVPEAVDTPLQTSLVIALVLTVKVVP